MEGTDDVLSCLKGLSNMKHYNLQCCWLLWTSGVWRVGEWAVPAILKDCCAFKTLTTTHSSTKYHFPEDLNL